MQYTSTSAYLGINEYIRISVIATLRFYLFQTNLYSPRCVSWDFSVRYVELVLPFCNNFIFVTV